MKKLRTKQKIGIISTILATLFAAIYLYNLEFDINVSDMDSLEKAIEDYNFTADFEVEVLKTERVGKYLYVLYKHKDYNGYGGLAFLEKGILGKYRFHNTHNFNHPLYCMESETIGKKHYLIIYGLNELPNVNSFELYGDEDRTQVIYKGGSYEAPFLDIIETPERLRFYSSSVRYFDSSDQEIDRFQLKELFIVDERGNTSSVGSAEQGMVYVLIGIVMILGIVLVRYFWQLESDDKKEEKTL